MGLSDFRSTEFSRLLSGLSESTLAIFSFIYNTQNWQQISPRGGAWPF